MFASLITKSNLIDADDHRAVAIYARVSTREQSELGYSVRDQEVKCTKYIEFTDEDNSIKSCKKYLDEGQSARSLDRKQMKQLIDDVSNNKVKAVVIHNLDRITRKMKDFIFLIELFEKYNVELISLREKLETNSAMGRFLVGIIILIAEWEADTISERTIRGIDRSAMEGNFAVSAIVPLGYKKVGKKLEIDSITSEVIKYVFKKIANNRFTVNGMVKHMELKYSIEGVKWTEKKLRKIIKNKLYMGTFENKRMSIENHSPAIVSKDLWEMANNVVKGRSRNAKYTYIFRERMLCADCNHPMKAEPGTSRNSTMYYYYRCTKCNSRVSEIYIQEILKYELNQYVRRYYRDKEIGDVNRELIQCKKSLNQAYKNNDIKKIGKLSKQILELEEKRDIAMSMGTKLWSQLSKLQKIDVLEQLNLDVIYFSLKKQGHIIARL